ncbi:MAG: PTS sugar transporter subunit IIA [Longicatena sp.]
MKETLLKESHIQVMPNVKDWKEAIKVAAQPLLNDGSIDVTYVDAMIQTVIDLGSYIVLAPNIALPHARSKNNVFKDSVSLLKLSQPVYFDENEDSRAILIIPIACTSNEGHMEMLGRVAEVLGDLDTIEKLLETNDKDEIYKIFEKI